MGRLNLTEKRTYRELAEAVCKDKNNRLFVDGWVDMLYKELGLPGLRTIGHPDLEGYYLVCRDNEDDEPSIAFIYHKDKPIAIATIDMEPDFRILAKEVNFYYFDDVDRSQLRRELVEALPLPEPEFEPDSADNMTRELYWNTFKLQHIPEELQTKCVYKPTGQLIVDMHPAENEYHAMICVRDGGPYFEVKVYSDICIPVNVHLV